MICEDCSLEFYKKDLRKLYVTPTYWLYVCHKCFDAYDEWTKHKTVKGRPFKDSWDT